MFLGVITLDWAVRLVARYGRGALTAKTDLYIHGISTLLIWNVVAHFTKIECSLLAWDLPQSLFTAVGDCLTWALVCEGVHKCIHYLDDFLFWGPPASTYCRMAMYTRPWCCVRNQAYMALAPAKMVSPSNLPRNCNRLSVSGTRTSSWQGNQSLPDIVQVATLLLWYINCQL